jgi:ribosomal protein S27AE
MSMKHSARFLLAFAVLTVVVPAATYAHFRLLEPASWIVENERGDPQKAGPCGGTNADWGKPSYVIGKVTGGQKLHIRIQETVYHPGHYRVALAVNSHNELPPDPETTTRDSEKGPWSVSALIQNPPQIPVLADGLFVHATRPTGQLPPWETDVQLPNINCPKCTLQVVQFMAEHANNNPGGYSYHHCAELQIAADPTKPMDAGWPAAR